MGVVRKTKSVKKILEAFEGSSSALSVVELVKRFESDMNKTTVYRVLERLEEEGVLHDFTGKDGLKWFAKCQHGASAMHSDDHPHFQCQDCGKSECLSGDVTIPTVSKHKVHSASLLLVGQCKDCIS